MIYHSISNSTALQYSMQNIADMLKVSAPFYMRMVSELTVHRAQYVLTMALSKPSQFKYAALASFISVIAGASTYLLYVKKERGHVLHHNVGDMIPLLRRKNT